MIRFTCGVSGVEVVNASEHGDEYANDLGVDGSSGFEVGSLGKAGYNTVLVSVYPRVTDIEVDVTLVRGIFNFLAGSKPLVEASEVPTAVRIQLGESAVIS